MNYEVDPLFWQRFLKCAGFYFGPLDGHFCSKSREAAKAFEQWSEMVAEDMGGYDSFTEGNIRSLLPLAQKQARLLMSWLIEKLATKSISFKIISGTRSYAAQEALYAKGRTLLASPILTHARAGQSYHNFGVAWDIGIYEKGKYLPQSEYYWKAGLIGKEIGLTWGGSWKSIKNDPHFQVIPARRLAETRAHFEAGKRLMA